MKYISLAKGFIPAVTLMAMCHASAAEATFSINFDEAGNGSYQTYNGTSYDAPVNDPGIILNGFLSYLLPQPVSVGAVEIHDSSGLSDILNFMQSGGSYYLQFLSGPGIELADSNTFPNGFSGQVVAFEDGLGNFTFAAGGGGPASTNFYNGFSGNGAGAVPEPSTWAMMLLGFGMVGFGLRNRRKPTVRVTYA